MACTKRAHPTAVCWPRARPAGGMDGVMCTFWGEGHIISHTNKCQSQENGWDEREPVMIFGRCWPSPRLSSWGARACKTWTGSLQGWSQTSTESMEFQPLSSFISLRGNYAPCGHTDQPKGDERSENEPWSLSSMRLDRLCSFLLFPSYTQECCKC